MAPPACAPGPGFPELTAAPSEETSDAISKQESEKKKMNQYYIKSPSSSEGGVFYTYSSH